MYNISTNEFYVTNVACWIDLGISFVLLGFMIFLFSRIFKTKAAIISEITLFVLTILSWFFNLTLLWSISVAVLAAIIVVFFLQNPKVVKASFSLFSNNKKKNVVERVYDREEVAKKVAIAVENLSKTKTGALISFEQHDKFDEIVKSGTVLNSPITPELLTTIFYPGTRLHDGAVVIRRDEILAASVYYTPTTTPLTGKYGSRHRAAIGISENTDAITVVVSEETGRISIAYKGELIPAQQDNVYESLLSYLKREN